MFGVKRKKNFFTETSGKTTNVEEPMLTKKQQETFQTKKNNTLSLYETENISVFTPNVSFVEYNTIKNLKVPLFVSDVHLIRNNECQDTNGVKRCDYCGIEHDCDKSLLSPTSMYEKEGVTYFEGSGYFHCFECLYRQIIDQIPYYSSTYPIMHERKKYLTQCMFALMYPNEKLVAAPRFENMNHGWNGKYTMIRLPGFISVRNINFYQLNEVPS